jgi:hypothetical protein
MSDEAKPVAWAAINDDGDIAWLAYTAEAAADGSSGRPIVPLYRHASLTDAEREAVETAAMIYEQGAKQMGHVEDGKRAVALRAMLERLG